MESNEVLYSVADAIASLWQVGQAENRFVVFTGGEPLLQLDAAVLDAMHARGFECAPFPRRGRKSSTAAPHTWWPAGRE